MMEDSLGALGAADGFGLDLLRAFSSETPSTVVLQLVPLFVLIGYAVLQLDRRRDGSPSRDDGQIGLKLVLFGVLAAAVIVAAAGTQQLLGFVLGGFKGGWAKMRGPLATMIAAGGAAAGVYLALLPRTNHQEKQQPERLAVGMVGALAGGLALVGFETFLSTLLAAKPWGEIASGLAAAGVWGGVTVVAIVRLGQLSGWRVIPRMPVMPMQPPMGGPMQPPPSQGGMPPLGGGYPPQGGGGGWAPP